MIQSILFRAAVAGLLCGPALWGQAAPSASAAADIQQKLANPVASLRTLPLQSNFDFRMGPNEDGFRYTLNLQPVLPFDLNSKWNLISRTIVPIISQTGVVGDSSQSGLGDISQSFFFSPKKTQPFIWGVGPVVSLPTATNELLGTKKLGLGATGVILKQSGQWTVGGLVSNAWSVAGSDSRPDYALTFMQPFLTYNTKNRWTYSVAAEATHEWKSGTSSMPVMVNVSKLLIVGKRPVTVGGGLRCWAISPAGGPQGCGFRIQVTPVFPR